MTCLEYFTNSVGLFRDDESEVDLTGAETRVCCLAWDGEVVPDPALHVLHRRMSDGAGWHLKILLADVVLEEPYTFPNVFDLPEGPDLFAMDPPNEATTQQEDSSGSVIFHAASCEDRVDLAIDAVAGSEYSDGTPLTVTGAFTASAEPPK